MADYSYEALDADGQPVAGETRAHSTSEAVAQLERAGLQVLAIHKLENRPDVDSGLRDGFHRRLQATLDKRHQWLPVLAAVAEELPAGDVRRETQRLRICLEGELTTEQLLQSSDLPALLPLLTSGVESQTSSIRLKDLLSQVARQRQRISSRRQALMYPMCLLLMLVLVVVLSSIVVVPAFRSIFDEFGMSLPAPTAWVVWISDKLTEHAARTVLVSLVLVVGSVIVVRTWRGRALTNRLLGRFVAGSTANLQAMSSFTGTLAELIGLGAPMSDALRIAGRSCQHVAYNLAARDLELQLRAASPDTCLRSRHLPSLITHALQAGSEGRPHVVLLRELSTLYAEQVEHRMDWLSSSLSATLTVLIGFLVGGLVIALMMPMISMVSSLA